MGRGGEQGHRTGRPPTAAPVASAWAVSVALATALAGCGAQPSPEAPARIEPTGDRPPPSPPSGRDDPRDLGADATFGELVEAALRLDQAGEAASSAGCLLRPRWRLEADLAIALRPLPPVPADLDPRLAGTRAAVDVLTRWGAYGPRRADTPSFVALTSTLPPRREPAIVWVVTDRGVYSRSSATAGPGDGGPPTHVAPERDLDEASGTLFVTAEAAVPVARVARELARVPPGWAGRVALAVALAEDTRLPEPPAPGDPADAAPSRCPDGLPPPAPDVPRGALDPQQVLAMLAPLRRTAGTCLFAAQGPGAAGARYRFHLRVDAAGTLDRACAVAEEPVDPALRRCLLDVLGRQGFPTPDPPGVVDLELPLVLSPAPTQAQRALCP
ncbi:MAG: hypothetical protein ACFCGT_06335 [Sandaracinaceae bacterium]